MNDELALPPEDAAKIAHNVYFTLKDWIYGTPKAGAETHSNLHNCVFNKSHES